MRHAEDFAFGYLPPLRKRERGSRSLGEQAAMEPAAKPLKHARHASADAPTPESRGAAAKVKAAEEEQRAFELAEGVVLSGEQNAMLRLLYELFSPKHFSFSKPFVDAVEAEKEGITVNLADVRRRFVNGGFSQMSDFVSEVRNVFAHCYMKFGNPNDNMTSKRCLRLDEVFERNVKLLPRSMREAAMAAATILRQDNDPSLQQESEWLRRSSRMKIVGEQTTLQLVEQVEAKSNPLISA